MAPSPNLHYERVILSRRTEEHAGGPTSGGPYPLTFQTPPPAGTRLGSLDDEPFWEGLRNVEDGWLTT